METTINRVVEIEVLEVNPDGRTATKHRFAKQELPANDIQENPLRRVEYQIDIRDLDLTTGETLTKSLAAKADIVTEGRSIFRISAHCLLGAMLDEFYWSSIADSKTLEALKTIADRLSESDGYDENVAHWIRRVLPIERGEK